MFANQANEVMGVLKFPQPLLNFRRCLRKGLGNHRGIELDTLNGGAAQQLQILFADPIELELDQATDTGWDQLAGVTQMLLQYPGAIPLHQQATIAEEPERVCHE